MCADTERLPLLQQQPTHRHWLYPYLVFLPITLTFLTMISVYSISEVEAHKIGLYYLSAYGVFATLHYILQFVLALLNRKKVNSIPELTSFPAVALNVAGYREDPQFFRDCLVSLRDATYANINRRIIVIDGCSEQDVYMATIATEVFVDCKVITLPEAFTKRSRGTLLRKFGSVFASSDVLCILQPHDGKRSAIRTAVEICMHLDIPFFHNTDSDTVLKPQCIEELMKCMSTAQISAVAGALEIFNAHETLLARLSHARYFYAFNVERAAQSYFDCVQCISGPNGLYRTADYALILEEWFEQKFMGRRATSGDDRHATSCLLARGKGVRFSHLAIASTETPLKYERWLQQQARWMKSYYRECGYLVKRVIPEQPFYVTYESVFGIFYPLALLISLVLLCMHHATWQSLVMLAVVTMFTPFIRALFCIWLLEQRWDLLLMGLYGPLYVTSLLPAKIHALLTILDFSWGTSARKDLGQSRCNCSWLMITVLVFNVSWIIAFLT